MRQKKKMIVTWLTMTMFLMTGLAFCFMGNAGWNDRAIAEQTSTRKSAIKVSDYVTSTPESLETSNAWQSERKLQSVAHSAWKVNKTSPVQIATVGGERAFKFAFNRGDAWAGENGVKFASAYTGSDIGKIVVRLYAHFTLSDTYGPDENESYYGVYLYNLNDDGAHIDAIGTGGYRIPRNIAEDAYVDLEISGNDISLFLDDTSGNFEGFQFAARAQWRGVNGVGVGLYNTGCYLAVSEISVYGKDEGSAETSMIKAADFVTNVVAEASETLDNSWQNENKLQSIAHSNWKVNKTGSVQIASVANESALKFSFNRGDAWAGQYGVKFKEAINGEQISSIVIRLAAHLSPTMPYGPDENESFYGVYLYNLNDDGAHIDAIGTGGYRIPRDVVQDAYVELKIEGENVALFLDDETGNFEGFQFGARPQGVRDTGNFIAISAIDVVLNSIVTFDYDNEGATPSTQVSIAPGAPVACPASDPERDGYKFIGWTLNGETYDFAQPVNGNITLTAKWEATDEMRVILDYGNYRKSVWVAAGEAVARPDDGLMSGYINDGWFLNGALYDFSAAVNQNLTLTAKWRNMNPVVTGLNDDFTSVEPTLQGVYGMAYETLSSQYGKGYPAWEKMAGETAGDSAYKIYFHSYGMAISSTGIRFPDPINPDEIGYLSLRVFAHLSSGATYSTSAGGVRLYALDATGLDTESGYGIPADVRQDTWTTIRLTGNDLKKLADADGMIRGFQLGAFFSTSDSSQLYGGSFGQRQAYFAIDGVTAGRLAYVTYAQEGSAPDKATTYTGTAFDYRLPRQENKVFLGWFKDDGAEVLPGTVIDWDLTVTAKFADAIALDDGVYWNENAAGSRGEGGYITVKDGKIDVSDVFTGIIAESGYCQQGLLVYLRDGTRTEYLFGADGFALAETFTVTFVTGFEGSFTYDVVKEKKLYSVELERLGYILNGWKAEESAAYFDFDAPISANTVLTADWAYDEIRNDALYETYAGSYYGAESGTTLTLTAGKTFTVKSEGVEKSGTYLILRSGTLVLIYSDSEKSDCAITGQAIDWANAEKLIRLKDVYLSFETDGGSAVASQEIGAEQGYKATVPEAPVKAGYTFKGWRLADGTAFDFDSVLTDSVQVFARWEAIQVENSGKEPGGCSTGAASAGLIGLFAAGILVLFKIKRNG